MRVPIKPVLKQILGELPLSAEIYWHLLQSGNPLNESFTLQQLEKGLPEWHTQVARLSSSNQTGKKVLIFSTLHYWISHATLMSLALAGLGHSVSLTFLPYGKWQKPINRFDLRRQNLYAKAVLSKAAPFVNTTSLLDVKPAEVGLPDDLQSAIEEVALRDTQYTLQVEEVSLDSQLYRLRKERNLLAARAALAYMQSELPEIVIIPNGSILEFGAIYRVARFLGLPVVTYEFGEQRGRIWLACNSEVMRQETDSLWTVRGNQGLNAAEEGRVKTLFVARQRANQYENFARRWQGTPSIGGEKTRQALGLDNRPVILLATNVIGDSLTLGRQVFSDSMTEWLKRTVGYFANHPEATLVVRIHPGELITKGPSVADVVAQALPELPGNIQLVTSDAQINTYDLIEIAEAGLVYTTTVGLEMAMSGLPVIVIGQTHYRGKGFTLDPESWAAYFDLLDKVVETPGGFQLSDGQVQLAWEYAYRFFFEYPHPFPWHLVHIWEDVTEWPLSRVFSEEGQQQFASTFQYLVGEPVDWSRLDGQVERGWVK